MHYRGLKRALALLAALLLLLNGAPGTLATEEGAPLPAEVLRTPSLTRAQSAPTPSPTAAFSAAGAETDAMAAPTPEPRVRAVTVRAVGDLMAHQKQLDIARRPDGSYSFFEQFALIRDSLSCADYTVANLETTIGPVGRKGYSGFPFFNTPESYLDAVADCGVDFLTLANNHMLDRYFDGLVQTANLVEWHGFDFGGSNRTEAEKGVPKIVEVNGVRLGFLCYTQSTNGMEKHSGAQARRFGVNYLRDADFNADVAALRDAGAEAVIAMVHWGTEYKRTPDSVQQRGAKLLAEAGVDVILGSHPHVVQPVRFLETKTGDGRVRRTLVAYSLGNFLSNMSKKYTDCGLILEFTLVERESGFSVENVGYVPTFCWRTHRSIQVLSSAKYYNNPPKGMRSSRVSDMRAGCRALAAMMGDELTLLTE